MVQIIIIMLWYKFRKLSLTCLSHAVWFLCPTLCCCYFQRGWYCNFLSSTSNTEWLQRESAFYVLLATKKLLLTCHRRGDFTLHGVLVLVVPQLCNIQLSMVTGYRIHSSCFLRHQDFKIEIGHKGSEEKWGSHESGTWARSLALGGEVKNSEGWWGIVEEGGGGWGSHANGTWARSLAQGGEVKNSEGCWGIVWWRNGGFKGKLPVRGVFSWWHHHKVKPKTAPALLLQGWCKGGAVDRWCEGG